MSSLSLSLPDWLYDSASEIARNSGQSIDQFIAGAVNEEVRRQRRFAIFEERAKTSDPADFQHFLDLVPDVPPMPGDELPDELRVKLARVTRD